MKNNGKNIKKGNVRKKKKIRKKNKYKGIDLYIFCSVLVLVAIGIIMVFSASYYDALYKHKNVFYFLSKELTWAPVGLIAMLIFTFVDYHFWKKVALPGYVITLITLIAVLFIGSNINGATRWIKIMGVSFQPSELAKYMIVFFLAMVIEQYGQIKEKWFASIIYLSFALVFSGLVLAENNLSISAIIMFVAFIIVFSEGMSGKITGILMGLGGIGVLIAIVTSGYRMKRFISFINPWKYATDEGYQLVHSLYAIGTGGLFGVGLGNSKQKALYMPEPHNDFIFAIICEELGLIGAIVIISVFLVLIVAGINVAMRAKDKYGRLLATGIISVIAVQVVINIAVVTGSMPVTGVPLPFISYGGTSLVFNLAAIGVLLNISSQTKTHKDEMQEKIERKRIKSKMNI